MLKRGHQQDDPYLPSRQGVGAMQEERLNPSVYLSCVFARPPIRHLDAAIVRRITGRQDQ